LRVVVRRLRAAAEASVRFEARAIADRVRASRQHNPWRSSNRCSAACGARRGCMRSLAMFDAIVAFAAIAAFTSAATSALAAIAGCMSFATFVAPAVFASSRFAPRS